MNRYSDQECTLTDDERVVEAMRIVKILYEYSAELSDNEERFVDQMSNSQTCSIGQLLWLRRIKDKLV